MADNIHRIPQEVVWYSDTLRRLHVIIRDVLIRKGISRKQSVDLSDAILDKIRGFL